MKKYTRKQKIELCGQLEKMFPEIAGLSLANKNEIVLALLRGEKELKNVSKGTNALYMLIILDKRIEVFYDIISL